MFVTHRQQQDVVSLLSSCPSNTVHLDVAVVAVTDQQRAAVSYGLHPIHHLWTVLHVLEQFWRQFPAVLDTLVRQEEEMTSTAVDKQSLLQVQSFFYISSRV